jgi:hypothetical protein
MKCWNSAFNAQGSRLIIVVVQLGAVKIYVASSSSGGAQEKGKTGSNSVYHQNWWFSSEFSPLVELNANVPSSFLQVCFESRPVYDQTLRVLVLCFSYFTDNSIIYIW